MAPKTRKNKIKEVDLIAYWSREMDMTPKQFEALAKEVGQLHQERLDGFHRSFPHVSFISHLAAHLPRTHILIKRPSIK